MVLLSIPILPSTIRLMDTMPRAQPSLSAWAWQWELSGEAAGVGAAAGVATTSISTTTTISIAIRTSTGATESRVAIVSRISLPVVAADSGVAKATGHTARNIGVVRPIATALRPTGLEAPHVVIRFPNASQAPGSKSAAKAGIYPAVLVLAA